MTSRLGGDGGGRGQPPPPLPRDEDHQKVLPSPLLSSASVSPGNDVVDDLKVYQIKVPKGLRSILNDLTREVLCEAPSDVVTQPELHQFCADYLERRLKQEGEKAITEEEEEDDAGTVASSAGVNVAAAMNQCATDSGR